MTESTDIEPHTSELATGSRVRALVFVGGVVLSTVLAGWIGKASELEPAATRALFILILAVCLWVTETIPAFSVGILIIGLKIALLGKPQGVFAKSEKDWEHFVAVLGHPLIWLFFGGFVLAAGMSRCGLDRWLAGNTISRFGEKPAVVLLGVMVITFVLSMFMSNTATTAMMLAILAPMTTSLGKGNRYTTGLFVGTAVAANLGGMGSLIGTPPNAIAVGVLANSAAQIDISFLHWMILGLPPAVIALSLAWLMLVWTYPCTESRVALPIASEGASPPSTSLRWERRIVAATLLATLLLWLSSQWHGLPAAAVAFLPIIVFTTTGILGVVEMRRLPYDVLFLMAGGLALGEAVTETGLSDWIVGQLPLAHFAPWAIAMTLAYLTVLLSNFMSNTAAANVLVPIGITIATGFEAQVAVVIAFGASAAMCLPVATPPNAMVYATGQCKTADFLRIGLVMGVLVPILGLAWLQLIGSYLL